MSEKPRSPESKDNVKNARLFEEMEDAQTLDEIVAIVHDLDEGDGKFTSDSGGRLDIGRTIEAIKKGGGENVSDSRIQQAVRRIESTSESDEQRVARLFEAMETVQTREELATLVRQLADRDGMFMSDSASGRISAERTAQSIEGGYGTNVSDSRVQRAALRIG